MSRDDRALDEYERRYMHPGEKLLYREKVVSHTAFRVSVVFSTLFALAGVAAIVAGLMRVAVDEGEEDLEAKRSREDREERNRG